MSTAKFNQWLNSDGTENYKCRAWVNFNGTGTVAIRAAGNVSSITDNGTGDYTVNFTTAMPDANYSYVGSSGANQATPTTAVTNIRGTTTVSTTSFRFGLVFAANGGSTGLTDEPYVHIAIFR